MSADRPRLADIEAAAAAATEGPWWHEPWGGQNQNGDYSGGNVFDAHGEYVVMEVSDADGAFMARARTDVPAMSEALRAVLALHQPWWEVDGVRHDFTVPVYGKPPKDHVCRIGPDWDACTIVPGNPEDNEHYVLACSECRCATDEGEPGYLFWPCATVRAIEAHIDTAPQAQEEKP